MLASCHQVIKGRGKGGLCQIYPKSLDHIVSRIPVTSTKRVMGCLLTLPTSRVLWINSYFPVHNVTINFDDSELQETLARPDSTQSFSSFTSGFGRNYV